MRHVDVACCGMCVRFCQDNLSSSGRLPVDEKTLNAGLQHVDFLIGSAPVRNSHNKRTTWCCMVLLQM